MTVRVAVSALLAAAAFVVLALTAAASPPCRRGIAVDASAVLVHGKLVRLHPGYEKVCR